jgi:Mg2+ and Co2+ transporter CorA
VNKTTAGHSPLRVFTVVNARVEASLNFPAALPHNGFVWVACTRKFFDTNLPQVQACLQDLTGHSLVDLHNSDLLSSQLPSRFDFTSHYDMLVFRRLSTRHEETSLQTDNKPAGYRTSGPAVLRHIDTSPVGFAIFDRVLLTVHPEDCAVRETYATRLLATRANASTSNDPSDTRSTGARGIPDNPADMMLRIVSQMVDGYLDLRRELTRQLDHWQAALLSPRTRFSNWSTLLQARLALHQLDEICEDQRIALQDWTESLNSWPVAATPEGLRAHELLKIRSRDVLEHIDRVVHHVQRLEHSIETAVQMHFNAQSNRTNDIMRTLTAITAIFLPLNLIAAVFGMNFEFIPLLHQSTGFWWTISGMLLIACTLGVVFWRKRFLAQL